MTPKHSHNSLSDLPIRDEEAALEAVGGDHDLARELFETLLAGLPAELEELKRLYTAGDWPELANLAHQIRGATRYCGVPALDEILGALQKAAESANQTRIDALIAGVNQQALRLLE